MLFCKIFVLKMGKKIPCRFETGRVDTDILFVDAFHLSLKQHSFQNYLTIFLITGNSIFNDVLA